MSLDATIRCAAGDLSVDVSLKAAPERPLAIVGPNGAGKTTVVRALAGLHETDTAHIELDGVSIDDVPARARPIGVVFQDRGLFARMSALENVAFGVRARGVGSAVARERARGLLDMMGIGDRANVKAAALSGGEAQRVAVARAIAHEPRVLLLDEPLAALDVRARAEMRALLAKVLAGFAGIAIIVTHDPVDAMTLAHDVVVMEHGHVTQAGTIDEIRSAPRTAYAAELVGVNLLSGRLEPLGDGVATLDMGGAEITVACSDEIPAGDATALLRPADVILYREQPSPGSARNVVRGVIHSIADTGERVRVRLDSSPSIVADVTRGSATRLGLAVGVDVWAVFKAVEVRLINGE